MNDQPVLEGRLGIVREPAAARVVGTKSNRVDDHRTICILGGDDDLDCVTDGDFGEGGQLLEGRGA